METILTYHILPKDVWEQESKNATFGHHEIEKYGLSIVLNSKVLEELSIVTKMWMTMLPCSFALEKMI